ncbi:hypothetical protein TraAM80_00490 [Trypanosoma rangeli]|uniref:Uncharacterized protein n=1 Tax=Trypanosoma rangeli TaxID=5698 RepID=A0A422P2X7_TRYRA|nr:uncharacterized protein TraAM80_00490 [Trypanosoma rangeli]RNF12073.1 hypothetical protein TraAM80_00490 [Trypanosoma rangeli]|eukprot:RNF12073.1 hypothetical protein TraAM80_00490 [Trypanosoma rangeli]
MTSGDVGGGGGVRELGTVTAGMAMMNFDEKTRPYTRADFLNFLQNYENNLSLSEIRLIEKGMLGTFVGMPLGFFLGYKLSSRLAWHRIVRVFATIDGKEAAGKPSWIVRNIPRIGKTLFGLTAATIPYMVAQQWFISRVLELDEHESNLSFHVRRLMITQRSGMMFKRTATREVTREEQEQLLQNATEQMEENRMGRRGGAPAGTMDVNLRLGQQVMTPVAQSGYKPMPGQSSS